MEQKSKKIRLDIYLIENNYFSSREKARIAIMEGKIFVNNQKEDKPGTMIKSDSKIEFRGEKLKYVSRGGLKLEKAFNSFSINVENDICMDIGASTGGFTDVMLQNGAKKVYAIDCGTNQLDYRLRTDKRVVVMENTNAKYLKKNDIEDDIDFVSIDVSFISLNKIIPVIKNVIKNNGMAVLLIKPQFEAGKEFVEKNGVVRDRKVHEQVVISVCGFCQKEGFEIINIDFSPIKGPAGNIEYLLYVKFTDKVLENLDNVILFKIKEVVEKSHEELKGN